MEQKFEFFWSTDHPFSQWHSIGFSINEITYSSAEQYMMHQKALLFDDEEVAEQILQTDNPEKQKALGRKVSNFDQAAWVANREQIVYDGNLAKFSQNENLKKFILGTKDRHIVESSPNDNIWGIGLHKTHPDAAIPENWKGLNLLGEVLMKVRETIKES